jgi:hypothetical protein
MQLLYLVRPYLLQALGSLGGQTAIGMKLTRLATILFWAEAEGVTAVAAAPVRARATTKARKISFMESILWNSGFTAFHVLNCPVSPDRGALQPLLAAGVGVVRRADGDRHEADAAGNNLVLGGSGGSHGGGCCTGKNEGGDEGTNDKIHGINPL